MGLFSQNYGEAETYLERAFELKEYLSSIDLGHLYENLGATKKLLNQSQEAIDYFLESVIHFENHQNYDKVSKSYYEIGLIYEESEGFEDAIKYFEYALDALKKSPDTTLLIKISLSLSQAYIGNKDIDSAKRIINDISSLEESYSIMSYDQILESRGEYLQKQEQELKIREQKKKTSIIFLVSILVIWFLICFSAIIMYINRKKRKLAEQQIDLLLQEQELKSTYARLHGQDIERKRIAQDLHDRLGSMLSTIKLYFNTIEARIDELKDSNKGQYDKATELLDEACEEVRRIAHNMNSGVLQRFGLSAQVKNLVETINAASDIRASTSEYGFRNRLPANYEIEIYRVIQELVSNVLKHSRASKLDIQLNLLEDEEVIIIIVQDDGIGFNMNHNSAANGIGLKNIQSRVYDLKGTISIDSGKHKGTTVIIDIPFSQSFKSSQVMSCGIEPSLN